MGPLGRALYGQTATEVRGCEFSGQLNRALDTLKALSPIVIPSAVPGIRDQLARIAATAAGDKGFVASPVISVDFLGSTMKVQSGDPSTECNLRLEALLKGLSVGYAGGVTPLPHESWLMPERASIAATIPSSSLEENETARLSFVAAARRVGNTALCQLKAMVGTESKCKKFKDSDPFSSWRLPG